MNGFTMQAVKLFGWMYRLYGHSKFRQPQSNSLTGISQPEPPFHNQMKPADLLGLTLEEAEKRISPKYDIRVVTHQTPMNTDYDPYRVNVVIGNSIIQGCSIG